MAAFASSNFLWGIEMQKKMRGLAALLIILLAARPAVAGQASATFGVSATVLTNCTVTASNLNFGNYSASAASPTNMSTSLSVTCTNGLAYTVDLNGGNSHSLNYQLYTTNGYASIFGDGTGGTITVSGSGNGSAQSIPVYGQIATAQYVPAGSYSDTISVTVNY
jgi:spore coat protein U-like protein